MGQRPAKYLGTSLNPGLGAAAVCAIEIEYWDTKSYREWPGFRIPTWTLYRLTIYSPWECHAVITANPNTTKAAQQRRDGHGRKCKLKEASAGHLRSES